MQRETAKHLKRIISIFGYLLGLAYALLWAIIIMFSSVQGWEILFYTNKLGEGMIEIIVLLTVTLILILNFKNFSDFMFRREH